MPEPSESHGRPPWDPEPPTRRDLSSLAALAASLTAGLDSEGRRLLEQLRDQLEERLAQYDFASGRREPEADVLREREPQDAGADRYPDRDRAALRDGSGGGLRWVRSEPASPGDAVVWTLQRVDDREP